MAVAFDQRDDELLGMAEVAAVAGVTLATARTWCLTGRLAWIPGVRSGRRLVRRSDLEAFLARRITAAAEPAGEAASVSGIAPARRRGQRPARSHDPVRRCRR